ECVSTKGVWIQVYQVRKEQKNVKRSIIKSVVGTLDLNIRYLLQGETFPGERVKTPFCCSTNRTPLSRYGYIANLCVAKSDRRQGIASNMMYFAVECAKSNEFEHIAIVLR
ncbi:acyl-CoA N-acyltransferase (NAT) superfamily protein, partial [Trifolium medium]|nr:acyl-CoA N-acyltransferase (NAT) superfamily protein [Trifolium medium]